MAKLSKNKLNNEATKNTSVILKLEKTYGINCEKSYLHFQNKKKWYTWRVNITLYSWKIQWRFNQCDTFIVAFNQALPGIPCETPHCRGEYLHKCTYN